MTQHKSTHRGLSSICLLRYALVCVGIVIGMFLAACGGDSGSSTSQTDEEGTDNTDSTDDNPGKGGNSKGKAAIDSVDTEDDLTACVAAYEGDSAFVKDSYSVFRCTDGLWVRSRFVMQQVKTEDDLPECTRNIVSLLAIVEDGPSIYRCGVESGTEVSWTNVGTVLASETDLPNCTSNRKGERAYIKNKKMIMVCEDKWVEWKADDRFLCGGTVFNPDSLFCSGTILFPLCGGEDYVPSKQFCSSTDSVVYDKCAGSEFDPSYKFCVGGMLYDKCPVLVDGKTVYKTYDVKKEFCTGGMFPSFHPGEILKLCNGMKYGTESFCANNRLFKKCGAPYQAYDVDTQSCENGELVSAQQCCSASGQCNTDAEQYNANYQFCDTRDYQIYDKVKIGSDVWMAQNLNYKDMSTCYYSNNGTCYDYGSTCYNGKDSYCSKYGRLYSSEMANDAVCPEGWHLPTKEEFENLYATVEENFKGIVIQALKSTDGWGEGKNGFDLVGFNLLP